MIYTDNSLKLVNILAKKIKNIKKKVLLRNNPNKTFKKNIKIYSAISITSSDWLSAESSTIASSYSS